MDLPGLPSASGALQVTALSAEKPARPRAAQAAAALGEVDDQALLTWILRSGVVFGLVFIAAIALAITAHCSGSEHASKAPVGDRAEAGEKTEPAERGSTTEAGATADPETEHAPLRSPPSAAAPAAAHTRPAATKSAPSMKHAPVRPPHRP